MRRRIGINALVCITVALIALPAAASANLRTVYAGPPPSAADRFHQLGADVNDFFGHKITIHEGDTIEWANQGFHTIDIPPVSQGDLPLFIPGATVSGVTDLIGNPFWFNGKVPSMKFNGALFAPSGGSTYNGSARVDSGLPLGPPAGFKVTFTKAGTYRYFCDVHYGMEGTIVVREPKQKVSSAAEDALALNRQVERDLKIAQQLDGSTVTGNRVSVGEAGRFGVEVFAMFPSNLTVKVGTVVKFSMSPLTRETHTASFGPEEYLTGLSNSLAGPAIRQEAVYASDNTANGPINFAPNTHGNGFANTGLMDEDTGTTFPSDGQIRFNSPGTYRFRCLIHPFMRGTVVVTS